MERVAAFGITRAEASEGSFDRNVISKKGRLQVVGRTFRKWADGVLLHIEIPSRMIETPLIFIQPGCRRYLPTRSDVPPFGGSTLVLR